LLMPLPLSVTDDEAAAAGADVDVDLGGSGVEGVFEELLEDGGGALDDFAGRDLVGDVLGQEADAVHAEFTAELTEFTGRIQKAKPRNVRLATTDFASRRWALRAVAADSMMRRWYQGATVDGRIGGIPRSGGAWRGEAPGRYFGHAAGWSRRWMAYQDNRMSDADTRSGGGPAVKSSRWSLSISPKEI
jgi:hypothetical protein